MTYVIPWRTVHRGLRIHLTFIGIEIKKGAQYSPSVGVAGFPDMRFRIVTQNSGGGAEEPITSHYIIQTLLSQRKYYILSLKTSNVSIR